MPFRASVASTGTERRPPSKKFQRLFSTISPPTRASPATSAHKGQGDNPTTTTTRRPGQSRAQGDDDDQPHETSNRRQGNGQHRNRQQDRSQPQEPKHEHEKHPPKPRTNNDNPNRGTVPQAGVGPQRAMPQRPVGGRFSGGLARLGGVPGYNGKPRAGLISLSSEYRGFEGGFQGGSTYPPCCYLKMSATRLYETA